MAQATEPSTQSTPPSGRGSTAGARRSERWPEGHRRVEVRSLCADHAARTPLTDGPATNIPSWKSSAPIAMGVCANAARRSAPCALQVADLWHLAHNLGEVLESFAVRVRASGAVSERSVARAICQSRRRH
jgi:hypothetical protein